MLEFPLVKSKQHTILFGLSYSIYYREHQGSVLDGTL